MAPGDRQDGHTGCREHVTDLFGDPAEVARLARKQAAREPALRPVTDALLDAALVAPGTRVLDLACGTGPVACVAQARGARVTGIDKSPLMLEHAPDCGASFLVGDMAEPPLGPWQAIVCRFGAHHGPEGWLEACASQLAIDGWLAIAEWDPDSPMFANDPSGRRPQMEDATRWRQRMTRAGLEPTTVRWVEIEDDRAFVVSGQRRRR